MKLLKVAAGVANQTPLDWLGNRKNIFDVIDAAKEASVTVLCLPELCISGYGCEDAFHAPGVYATSQEILKSIVPKTKGIIVSVGVPVMYAGGLFNTAAFLVDGAIAGFVAKQHLAGDGIHYEPRWFKPWPEGVAAQIEIDDQMYPIGDLLFDVGGVRIGFEICEDAWVGTRPGARLAARGADIILNPSASHFAFGKHGIRKRFVIEGSRAFNVTYVYANLLGNESGRAIFDGDAMIAINGELVELGDRLSFNPVGLTSTTVDINATRMSRARSGSFLPEVDGDESDVIKLDFDFPDCRLAELHVTEPAWEAENRIKYEEFTRAVCLGLFDYMRKSHSQGFVISMSGGADSAACATLVAMMIKLAEAELGLKNTMEIMGKWTSTGKHKPKSAKHLIERSLTTVYQSTRNSGDVTRNAARTVANALGANHLEFDVDSLVNQYQAMVSQAVGYELDWDDHDIALQNIQCRVRSPGVWMLANLNHALLLSTSNRSESAVGYATMDGDTSGGLSPIAGIDKAFLRKWLKWMETDGPIGIGPVPELNCVNVQQPTAELRPPAQNQTDEGDLMPYDVLDRIERLAIRDKLMPVEVFEHLQLNYPDVNVNQLGEWVIKFFPAVVSQSMEAGTVRTSFHLDDENLDPKTWCRFPILSGGFEYEIKKLKAIL